MPLRKSTSPSAVVHVEGPVRFWLDGELVLFKVMSGDKVVCGAISALDFIESFARAAEIAHLWSSEHFSDCGGRLLPKISRAAASGDQACVSRGRAT